MCEWLYCGFIYGEFFAFPFRRETKTKPLIAAGHLCLEWVSPCIGTTQKSIPGSTGFVLPNKHSVVVVGAFVEDSCPDAGFDDLAVDTTLQKIGKHPAVIFRAGGKRNSFGCSGWETGGT